MSLQFKRSSAAGLEPVATQLAEGELAINLFDKKIYTLNQKNEVINIGFSQSYADESYLALSGGVMKGRLGLKPGTLPATGSAGLDEVVSRRYIDSLFGVGDSQVRTNLDLDKRYLKLTGGTVGSASSKLYLNYLVDESQSQFQAANMAYVMDNYVHITRDTNVQGYISLAKDPVNSRHATPRSYVDGLHNNAISYVNTNYNQAVNYTNQQIAAAKSYTDQQISSNANSGDKYLGVLNRSKNISLAPGNIGYNYNDIDFVTIRAAPIDRILSVDVDYKLVHSGWNSNNQSTTLTDIWLMNGVIVQQKDRTFTNSVSSGSTVGGSGVVDIGYPTYDASAGCVFSIPAGQAPVIGFRVKLGSSVTYTISTPFLYTMTKMAGEGDFIL